MNKCRGKKEEKASNVLAKLSQEEFSDDDDVDDDDDDVNDTYTRNKKQKETEPFTDQRENGLSIERTFISNQRQEKDAKRRRTKWPTIKKKVLGLGVGIFCVCVRERVFKGDIGWI